MPDNTRPPRRAQTDQQTLIVPAVMGDVENVAKQRGRRGRSRRGKNESGQHVVALRARVVWTGGADQAFFRAISHSFASTKSMTTSVTILPLQVPLGTLCT